MYQSCSIRQGDYLTVNVRQSTKLLSPVCNVVCSDPKREKESNHNAAVEYSGNRRRHTLDVS